MEILQHAPQEKGILQEERKFVAGQGKYLESILKGLHLPLSPVNSEPELRDSTFFADRTVLAMTGFYDLSLAALAASGNKKVDLSEHPSSLVLIAPTETSSGLLVGENSNHLYGERFWICEDGLIKYIIPSSPVRLDSLNIQNDTPRTNPELFDVSEQKRRLHELSDDKYKVRQLLYQAGIPVPRGILVHPKDKRIDEKVTAFVKSNPGMDGYVLKSLDGAHGSGVMLLRPDELQPLLEFSSDNTYGKNVPHLVEERIVPNATPDVKSKLRMDYETAVDYNYRILVTIDAQSPTAITGEIRYRENDDTPVNLTLPGDPAKAATLDVIDEGLVARLNDVACAATQALCQKALKPGEVGVGYAGVDLITDKYGHIYVIEVNAGGAVGGLGTLTRLREKPLTEIKDILIPAWIQSLDPLEHESSNDSQFRPIPQNNLDMITVVESYFRERMPEKVEAFLCKNRKELGSKVVINSLIICVLLTGDVSMLSKVVDEVYPDNTAPESLKETIEYFQKHPVSM